MERVFVDTNIVIDLLAKREPYYKWAQELFTFGDRKKLQLSISALTFANAYYSILRHHKDIDARRFLSKFKVLVSVLPVDDKCIELALASDFVDFEDGLQYFVALENQAEVIITRNKKDFKSAKIPVMSAEEFLSN